MTNRTTEVACLSWGEVCARRLDRHALSAPLQDARPADIVATICGAHAQVLSAAELSIGLRLAGITRTAIRQALWTERSLVKTFGPRGTVHLLPTQDLPMWTGALSALPPARKSQTKDVRLTPEQTERVVEAIAMALEDAELTIDELSEAVIASTGPWAADLVMPAFGGRWPRWRQALTTAADRGALCFGPHRGSKVTYINPRRWLPGFRPADGQTALAAKRALTPAGQAGNFPVLLIDGTVAGVWHLRRSGRKLDITVEPFDNLTATQRRDLDEQVERIGEFLEGQPQLTIGTVTAGGHA